MPQTPQADEHRANPGSSLNPTVVAMRAPITTLCLVVALVAGGVVAFQKMRVDIFPALNVPKIYVFLDYMGMSPDQVEGFIVNQLELYFQYVDGVQDINTRNIQQVALTELSFFPGTDMGQAMAQVVAMSDRAMSWMPKGTLPPMIMRMDAGSVPVGYLVFRSKDPNVTLGDLGDLAQNIVRPLVQKFVPGTVAISPFGPNMRSITVNVDPHKLLTYNLKPQDVLEALAKGNTIIPAGNIYIKTSMPMVMNNATASTAHYREDLGAIPLKLGRNVYLRDVAVIKDATDIDYGYALVDGEKTAYLPIIKKDTGSTLKVVSDVRENMRRFRNDTNSTAEKRLEKRLGSAFPKMRKWAPSKKTDPEGYKKFKEEGDQRYVTIDFEFDESPTVEHAVHSVETEGMIGAGLTGLMILIFLRDPRSVIVVVSNIPLALLGSMFGLYLTGNTINIMSLGGLALAIGILVDEATVTIENVHVQMDYTRNLATAVLHASNATAVPRLLALMCILSVFIPAFLMENPLRSLFMPLTLGVGFAMISSYLLSSTFVPILCVYLLKQGGHEHGSEHQGFFGVMLRGYGKLVNWFVRGRWVVVGTYLGVCALILATVGVQVGRELFPQVDAGQFVLRFRAPPGSNFELTRRLARRWIQEIEEDVGGPQNIDISMGMVGQVAPNFGIDNMVLFMRGPDDGQLRFALKEDCGVKLVDLREKLRQALPERIIPWLKDELKRDGWSEKDAEEQSRQTTVGFQPGDMVTSVMSFGAATPIGIRVTSTDLATARRYAEQIAGEMKNISTLRDVGFEQELDYPTVEVNIDREKANLSGATVEDVAKALVMATSSTRFTNLNYWIDDNTGFDYLVQIQIPPLRMDKPEDVEILPLTGVNPFVDLTIRDVATVKRGNRPGEIDRDMSQRYVTINANVEGEDMGRAANRVEQVVVRVRQQALQKLRKEAEDRGQVAPSPEEKKGAEAQIEAIDEALAHPENTALSDQLLGAKFETMGQLPLMRDMFLKLSVGLGIAVFVIALLLTAYFQSFRLAMVAVAAVPGVVAGIATILFCTHTNLSIESFMGSIMCLGVSVSNSVMLVTFMNEHWKEGKPGVQAAILGASERLRPILMTACAMTVGMVPMALALERGSEMQAPLGRAVIGGLVMSTFATLLVLPSVFAVIIGGKESKSPSIYPDDPHSRYYDPLVYAHTDEGGHEIALPAGAPILHPHEPDEHLVAEWREHSPLPGLADDSPEPPVPDARRSPDTPGPEGSDPPPDAAPPAPPNASP
jgi:multidrug efflux pump subunit AcrB